MSDSVENWESIIQKTVRSSEGNLIGNVDAVDENSILVSTEGGEQDTRYQNILYRVLMVIKFHSMYRKQNLKGSKERKLKVLEK
jgi:hypothetical protein